MKKKNFVTGCAILMLVSLTGCSRLSEPVSGNRTTDSQTTTRTTESEQQTEDIAQPQTEETQTQTQVTPSEPVDLGELSDDLYSYQIIINGELYQLPMDFSELSAKGWKLDGDENEELDAYTYVPFQTFKMGDYEIEAGFVNLTDSPQPYSACQIVAISVDLSYNWQDDNDMTFILPKGIQSGKSTPEDVKKAYGEPSSENPGDRVTILRYEEDFARKEIHFSFSDGILNSVEVMNKNY